ncbi:MAG: DEAD/DEAH box helicase [Thermoplasmata archaeon]
MSIPSIDLPEPSRDLVLTQPDTHETAELGKPQLADLDADLLLLPFEIVDVLDPMARPTAHGTIYIKKEDKVVQRGQARTKTRVEPFGLRKRLDPKGEPKGLDIFEMLLPILMPPAATEFREELLFPGELYPFQRAGVKWLFENESALLADDMGLGKTVQAITAFRALIRRSLALQALVVCPKSVLTNWMRELKRWAPELVAIQVHGNQQRRRIAWRAYVGKCHVLVTTYETIRQDRESVRGRTFDLIVCDEVQKIKNPEAAVSEAVRNLSGQRRWALTGTPLENKPEDLVAVFEFVKPGLFQTGEIPFLSLRALRERVRPYILRRRKEDALPDLPEKVIDSKWLELTESQRRTYDRAEREGVDRLRTASDVTLQHVLALIQKLKQICNFDPQTGESTKLEFMLEEFLEEACEDRSKALVISQYVETLEELRRRLGDYEPLVYTGQLSTAQRGKIEEAFSSRDEHRVLLLSLRAGGLGLNLTRANYVLHFDRWWNPAVERQAEDRTHRIGQLKTVFVTRLICQDTIEERIEQLLERKKIIFQEVIDELADVSLERVLSEEELFGLFGLTPPRRVREKPPEAAREVAVQPASAEKRAAVTIRPEEPYSNLVKLRRILRESEEYIWWADLHFHSRGLEELIVCIDPAIVHDVRILSGPANVDERAKREFARFREEVQRKGINADWRVLRDFAHDRFIVSKNACFNVPPINSILRGSYGEMLQTPNRPPFENWWDRATPIGVRPAQAQP